jgi:Concanavalin A-like lectin/glucanases superfamily/Secretion system C-terminal sorting domain
MKKTLYVFVWACSALLALPAAAQVPAYVPTDGLVGWWPFCGNANDESGNGHDGNVFETSLSQDRFGNSESAYFFDGLNDYIQVPHHPDLNSLPFSISFWMKANTQIGEAKIFNKVCCSSWNGWDININGVTEDIATMHFEYYNAPCQGIYQTYCSPVPYPQLPTHDDVWHHFVFTVDSTQANVYLDGNIVLTQGWDGPPTAPITSVALDIGRYGFGNNYFYQGLLDDIGIWNNSLSEAEVQALYLASTGPCTTNVATNCTSLPANLQQGLVGYWPFCGNANDESGNGNDGTVNGATLTEDRFGNANAAYGFDGVNNSIITPALLNASNDFTFSCWVNTNSESSQTILNTIPHTVIGYSLNPWWAGSGNIGFLYGNGQSAGWSSDNSVIDNPIPFLNSWVHHVINKNGQHWTFLENGAVIYEFDSSYQPADILAQFVFGHCDPSICDETFSGTLDDIGIWNRALTPEEVQELYTLDACTFTVYDTSYVTVYDTLTTYETVYDTLYTYETIYDTVTTYVTVTDTLLIDITFIGFEGQPSWLNTVTVFPNPASDHITIDYGNFALMAGYNTIITDAAGATVYSSAVNSQQAYIDINAWGATGVYYMTIYDASGAPVAVRHIVLE